jgi:hypothetical protein
MTEFSSLLVSCCGAYADSGLGTGGLACLHEGRAVVVDKQDSTGLWLAGDTAYRAVRSMHCVLGYDTSGLKYWLDLPDVKDVHDLLLLDGLFVVASTGRNELCWYDPLGNLVKRWRADGQSDAWHLNCLWPAGGRLYASAFGKFPEHRGWAVAGQQTGIIFDVDTGEEIVGGLSGPHNPRYLDGVWLVCNSHTKTLFLQEDSGAQREVRLEAFTRGLAYDERYFYVGESANRKDTAPKNHSNVVVLERTNLEIVGRLQVPIPEIYEIVVLPSEFAASIVAQPERFAFDFNAKRVAALEGQVERGYQEIRRLRHSLTQTQNASLRYRLGTFRRKLVRAIVRR